MTPEKKNRLKELLGRIKTLETAIPAGEIKSLTDQIIGDHITGLGEKMKADPVIKYLDSLNEKIGQFKKDFNLGPVVKELNNLIDDVTQLRTDVEANLNTAKTESESKISLLKEELSAALAKSSTDSQEFTKSNLAQVSDTLEKLNLELFASNQDSKGNAVSLKEAVLSIEGQLEKIGNKIKNSNQKHTESIASLREEADKSLKDSIALLRKELMSRIGNFKGGGNANRNIAVNGNTSVLSKYTDINIKPGSNVTLTYTNNNTTKMLDLTISSSGGGGGNSRSVQPISSTQSADGTAGTDFVYICSAGLQLTLPTASGNSNLYTIKNTAASSVLLSPDGSDTIDSQSNLILRTQYTAVDLISDGSGNWNIT